MANKLGIVSVELGTFKYINSQLDITSSVPEESKKVLFELASNVINKNNISKLLYVHFRDTNLVFDIRDIACSYTSEDVQCLFFDVFVYNFVYEFAIITDTGKIMVTQYTSFEE